MKTPLTITLLACICIFGLDKTRAQDLIQTFKTKEGFTYKLPAGWKRIGAQTLESYTKEMSQKMPNAQLPLPSDGFEPESIQSGIGYPNILVLPTVMPKNVGAITSEDLKRLANKTKERLQKKLDSKFQDNSMDATVSVKDVSYDENGQFVRMVTVGEVPDMGTIHSVNVLFGTKDGILTFQFNSRESDYGQYTDLFSKIISAIVKPVAAVATAGSAGANSIATNPPAEEPATNSKEAEDKRIDAIASWIGRVILPAIIIAVIWRYKSKKVKSMPEDSQINEASKNE